MKYAKLLLVLLLASVLTAQAQNYKEYLIQMDPSSGGFIRVDSIPGVHYIQTGLSCTAIDGVNNRFFFKGDDPSGVFHMITLDANTGHVLHNPVFPTLATGDNAGQFQFDDSTQKLYGISWSDAQQTEYFISIDEVTGVITRIAPIPGATEVLLNSYTYDQKHHIYFFTGSDRFFAINALTGQTIYSPSMTPNSIHSMRFDDRTGVLYGNKLGNFIKIDPATAGTTIIGTVPGVNGTLQLPNYTSFDNVHQRYTFGGDNNGVSALYTVDTAGHVIYSPTFPPTQLQSGENVIELNYNLHNGILYGLHWHLEPTITNPRTGIEDLASDPVYYHPNPFTQSITFSLPETYGAVTLSVYNLSGQLIRTESRTNTCEIIMDRGDMAVGTYSFEISSAKGSLSAGKVIVK